MAPAAGNPGPTDSGRDLTALFSPGSVAIVGASDDGRKWGNWLALGALRGEHRRPVYLVNRRAREVLGRPAYGSLAELPASPDLVVLAVPAASFAGAVDEALAASAKAIVGITAGLAETGEDGRALEEAAVERVRAARAVLLGPNCLGVMNFEAELFLTSNELPEGRVGVISQSGNLALELGMKASQARLGFSRFASVGNQADLEVADLVEEFAGCETTDAIAVYCEDFRDGRRFLEASLTAAEAGKPVVLLTVGSSKAAARAARSHTGALVSGGRSIDAACRAAGIERVTTPKELIDLLQGLLVGKRASGQRVGILADGGGHGAIAAEVAEARGLEVQDFSEELQARLTDAVGTPGGRSNPVDLAGAGEQDIWSFERVVTELLDSDEVDSVLVTGYFGGYSVYAPDLAKAEAAVAEALAALARRSPKPLVVHAMHYGDKSAYSERAETSPLDALRDGGVPVYPNVEDAATTLARLWQRPEAVAAGLPQLPEPRPGPDSGGYFAARALLVEHGVPLVEARQVATGREARLAASELGYPVVVKAAWLEHKSDAGGVVLDVASDERLDEVVADLWSRIGPGPLSVEAMARQSGVELLIGAVRDARFGPVALVGMGGVYAEMFTDVAACLAPIGERKAEILIRSLRGAPLLLGARGHQPLDLAAAAQALVALSQAAASHPQVTELEVNPLLVTASGAWGLDARLVLHS